MAETLEYEVSNPVIINNCKRPTSVCLSLKEVGEHNKKSKEKASNESFRAPELYIGMGWTSEKLRSVPLKFGNIILEKQPHLVPSRNVYVWRHSCSLSFQVEQHKMSPKLQDIRKALFLANRPLPSSSHSSPPLWSDVRLMLSSSSSSARELAFILLHPSSSSHPPTPRKGA